ISSCSVLPTLDPTSGTATCTVSSLTLGNHTFNARYLGNTVYTSVAAPGVPVTVTAGGSTTTTISNVSATPALNAKPVSFTAAVAVVAPAVGTPQGTVTFFDGTISLGTAQVQVVSGKAQATFTTSSLAMGRHLITARYDPAANFQSSTSAQVEQW